MCVEKDAAKSKVDTLIETMTRLADVLQGLDERLARDETLSVDRQATKPDWHQTFAAR